jgi:hypothetical protein
MRWAQCTRYPGVTCGQGWAGPGWAGRGVGVARSVAVKVGVGLANRRPAGGACVQRARRGAERGCAQVTGDGAGLLPRPGPGLEALPISLLLSVTRPVSRPVSRPGLTQRNRPNAPAGPPGRARGSAAADASPARLRKERLPVRPGERRETRRAPASDGDSARPARPDRHSPDATGIACRGARQERAAAARCVKLSRRVWRAGGAQGRSAWRRRVREARPPADADGPPQAPAAERTPLAGMRLLLLRTCLAGPRTGLAGLPDTAQHGPTRNRPGPDPDRIRHDRGLTVDFYPTVDAPPRPRPRPGPSRTGRGGDAPALLEASLAATLDALAAALATGDGPLPPSAPTHPPSTRPTPAAQRNPLAGMRLPLLRTCLAGPRTGRRTARHRPARPGPTRNRPGPDPGQIRHDRGPTVDYNDSDPVTAPLHPLR